MILQRFVVVCSLAHRFLLVAAQVQEATLVASSSFRMAISPTIVPLEQVTLNLIRVTAVNGLKELQSNSGLQYLLNTTKVVLQQADLQQEENMTIIHFFALTTQMAISIPQGTSFLEVRQRNADNRKIAFNDFVEDATGNLAFIDRLQQNAELAFGNDDRRISADALSQILAIKSVEVVPVSTPDDIPDGLTVSQSTSTKNLSVLDIFLIMLIMAIFFATVYVLIQFRRGRKESEDAAQTAELNGIDLVERHNAISHDFQMRSTAVFDEEAARPTSSKSESHEEKMTPIDVQKCNSDRSSSSSKSASSCSTIITAAKSLRSNHSTKNEIQSSLVATSIAGLQAISLSRSDSVAFVDDDVSDDAVELLQSTLGATIRNRDILAETSTDETALSRLDAIALGQGLGNVHGVESLAESFASDFFGSEGSSSDEGNFRGTSTKRPASSSSSYYSSEGSTSSDDLLKVDVEAASNKSGPMDSKQPSKASMKEWMKTVNVVSGSSTTDSKTTSSSQERSAVSSLTAPSMAASIGVSSLELSLSRLDYRQAKKSTFKEDEDCLEI